MRRAAPILAVCAGCGFGIVEHDPAGGSDNLPTLGAGPYGRPTDDLDTPAQEPFVIHSASTHFADPACLPRAGGGLRLWFGRVDPSAPERSSIAYAEVPSLADLPDVGPTVVVPEGASPAVVRAGDRHVMIHELDGALVRRESPDGLTWGDPRTVLSDAADPTVAIVDGIYHLFFTRPGLAGIWRARSDDGLAFERDLDAVILPRPGVGGAFDTLEVGEPFVRVEVRDAGRQTWGLWFTGVANPELGAAVGYAGSFDGEDWERFAGVDPVLAAPAGGPCVVVEGPRGTLLFHDELRRRQAIAGAVHP
jgi:hypothetical protein